MLSTPLNHLTDRELLTRAQAEIDELTSRDTEIELVKRFADLLDAHEDDAVHLGDLTVQELADGNTELDRIESLLSDHGLDTKDLESFLDSIAKHYVGQGTDVVESLTNDLYLAQQFRKLAEEHV